VSCKSDPKTDLAPNTYQIDISAKGVYNGMRAYITQADNRGRQIAIDTAIVMNESLSFNGNVKSPSLKTLTVDGIKETLPIVLESGIMTINLDKDNIKSSQITGSANNELLKKYLFENTYQADYAFDFIDQHPNSDFSLLLLESLISTRNENIDRFKKSSDLLSSIINKSPENKVIGQKIENFIKINEAKANVNIGKIAPDFSAPTPNGEMLSLNDIKGKATIIDFWASWCRPCRVENPNVVKVYEKYHDKGLEIISVSLDKKGQKNRWLKAIEDDNLQWHHVSNLKFWNEPVARMYNVSSIPATFILDAKGKIVAKKLRGKALEDKIAELLD
jgi:peroxiredoxin